MNDFLRGLMFRAWYWYVNNKDKNAEILFMNYGYSDPNLNLKLSSEDEPNRYSIQLYHHLADTVDIKNKDIIEVGCGRGGGLAYVVRNFSPASAQGLDLDKRAITFCNHHYRLDNLSFKLGDAQNLPFGDNSTDVIMNVESSHRYPDMKLFIQEVIRVLRPGGYFLITDFRLDYEMAEVNDVFNLSGLNFIKKENINRQVLSALTADDARRRELVERLTPKILNKTALNFAGNIGSETFNRFETEKYMYFTYILQKK